jgi:t-SNARE complex subunit (syntaxin)
MSLTHTIDITQVNKRLSHLNEQIEGIYSRLNDRWLPDVVRAQEMQKVNKLEAEYDELAQLKRYLAKGATK